MVAIHLSFVKSNIVHEMTLPSPPPTHQSEFSENHWGLSQSCSWNRLTQRRTLLNCWTESSDVMHLNLVLVPFCNHERPHLFSNLFYFIFFLKMGTTLTDETEVLSQCCLKHSKETLCEDDWWVVKRNVCKKKKKRSSS